MGEGGHTCGWRSLLDTVLPDRRGPGSGRARGAGLGRERSARGREGKHLGQSVSTAVAGAPCRGQRAGAASSQPLRPTPALPEAARPRRVNPDPLALTHHLAPKDCRQPLPGETVPRQESRGSFPGPSMHRPMCPQPFNTSRVIVIVGSNT